MYGSERPMGPVPCIAAKDLWDQSHAWLLDKHGTGPIGQLGLHIITSDNNRDTEKPDNMSVKMNTVKEVRMNHSFEMDGRDGRRLLRENPPEMQGIRKKEKEENPGEEKEKPETKGKINEI